MSKGEKMKCPICEKGNLEKNKVDYIFLGKNLGKFEAEVCDKCGEQIFEEIISKQISGRIKELGLWGLSAKTKVSKTGNSLTITVTKKLADFLKLKKGEEVIIYPEDEKKLVVLLS